jgi:hypothetical protein
MDTAGPSPPLARESRPSRLSLSCHSLQMCGCGVVCAEDIPYSFILELASVSEANKDGPGNEEKVA